jgi:hypothetical protein
MRLVRDASSFASVSVVARLGVGLVLVLAPLATFACGESKPAESPKMEMVAIDESASAKPSAERPPVPESSGDPIMTSVAPPSTGSGATAAATPTAGKGGPGGARVSPGECSQLFDRYIDLSIANDARLAGVTKDMIAAAKAQARAQKGDPCNDQVVTRKQYNCAMAARSAGEWQTCMQ